MASVFAVGRWTGLSGLRIGIVAALLAAMAGCAAPVPSGITDPHEARNRKVHEFNKSLDQNLVRPSAFGYGHTAPGPVRIAVQNFAQNLGLPGDVLNDVLQAKPEPATHNTLRFIVNTTVGIAGLFDPATAIGLPGKPTGFGETLHVWGFGEGNYVELPLFGPSTGRDSIGLLMDIALDPLRFTLPTAAANASTGVQVIAGLGRRYRYSDEIDAILYGSADSYAQLRLLYLQNRRYQLGQAVSPGDFVDPYEDPYAN